jgi:hypothetical protein
LTKRGQKPFADQNFHLDYEPLTGDGRTKSVQNLVTHAALHVRLRLG